MIMGSIEIIKDKLKELNSKDTLELHEVMVVSQLKKELIILEKLAEGLTNLDITGSYKEFEEKMSGKDIYFLTKEQTENIALAAKKYRRIKKIVDGEQVYGTNIKTVSILWQ